MENKGPVGHSGVRPSGHRRCGCPPAPSLPPTGLSPWPDGGFPSEPFPGTRERRVWWKEHRLSSDTPALASCWHPRSQLHLVNTEVAHRWHALVPRLRAQPLEQMAWFPPRSTAPHCAACGDLLASSRPADGMKLDGRDGLCPHALTGSGPGGAVDLTWSMDGRRLRRRPGS